MQTLALQSLRLLHARAGRCGSPVGTLLNASGLKVLEIWYLERKNKTKHSYREGTK